MTTADQINAIVEDGGGLVFRHDGDLRLPNGPGYADVSRHHCLLHIDPPAVWVRDLGSRNGTRVNGTQIGHPTGRDAVSDGGGRKRSAALETASESFSSS